MRKCSRAPPRARPCGPPNNRLRLQTIKNARPFVCVFCYKGNILIICFFFSSRRRHTRLTCDWSSDVCSSDLELPTITSDRLALEQVFSNLMDNAVKYLRAGVPGSIEVRATESDGAITYEAHDNGRGIDAKDRERIFDLFRRSGIQDRPGDGIGLAHTRALVRRLGGSINVESEPDRGSVFKVTLPKIFKVTLPKSGPLPA